MTKTPTNNALDSENPLAVLIKGIAQIRLAGLGAIAKVQQEGGALFDSLIKEGEMFEARHKLRSDRTKTVPAKPLNPENIEDLEKIFQDRVARALKKLDVPTTADVLNLHQQLETLKASIKALADTTRKS